MRISIVIPVHNEERTISLTLNSLVRQTSLAYQVVVVNDNSTDRTQDIISEFTKNHDWITAVNMKSSDKHLPGSKVINAFYKGYETLDDNYDVICKFDADIILPQNYLEEILRLFEKDETIGIASGLLYIKKQDKWVYEAIASRNHVRGPIKSYRRKCFDAIGGLKPVIGWDTIDVLLAESKNWNTKTLKTLVVKHLKPTGLNYSKEAKYLNGERWYNMRYGTILTLIASLKAAIKARSLSLFRNSIKGYFLAKSSKKVPPVTEEQGKFIRKLRWRAIRRKFLSI